MGEKIRHSLSVARPSVLSLGFGLFLAVNASGVWGGVFPFLPLDFQTPGVMLSFFIAQALMFFAVYLLSVWGSLRLPRLVARLPVRCAGAPYLAGWVCLIAAMYVEQAKAALAVASGLAMGAGAALFYLMWQRLFASLEPERGITALVQGFACGALIYYCLHLMPGSVTVFLVPVVFLPLFGLCLTVQSRGIDREAPMFADKPSQHAEVYRQAVRDYWRSAISVAAVSFCAGVMRALAIGEPQMGTLVNLLSMAGALLASALLLFAWRRANVSLSVPAVYRVLFPFLITSILLVPFLPSGYLKLLAAALYAAYSVAMMLSMIQAAQASRDKGLNPVFIYGLFGSLAYGFHDMGFIGITVLRGMDFIGITSLGVVALVAVYVLGFMFFLGTGGFKAVARKDELAERIELVAPREVVSAAEQEGVAAAQADPLVSSVAALSQSGGLSAREAEVVELVARGYTAAAIAEKLYVSTNTVHTHVKRIYAKLGIHKKGELLDLVNS